MNENKLNKFCVPDEVLNQYFDINKILNVEPIGSGYISQSYLVTFPESKYVLQKIDEEIYSSPYGVIMNLERATKELRRAYIYEGMDHRNSVIKIVETVDDQPAAIYDDEYWKCRRYLYGVKRVFETDDLNLIKEAAKTIAHFPLYLKELHSRTIVDTIPHFHDTYHRFNDLVDICKIDEFDRVSECVDDINYLYKNFNSFNIITNLLDNKVLPRRICHNNPKLCNVIFDEITNEGIGLANLETIMKGSLCFEFGDAVRSICSNCENEHVTKENIKINFASLNAFIDGYLEVSSGFITKEEVDHLYDGWLISTLELAIRYLIDFIDGDKYFKYDEEVKEANPFINLEKARIQIELSKLINTKEAKDNFNKSLNEALVKFGYPCEFLQK